MERDINLAKSGKEDLIYKTLIGLKADLSKPAETPEILVNKYKAHNKDIKEESNIYCSSESSDVSDSEYDKETENMDDIKSKFINSARPRNESPESKKVRYQQTCSAIFNTYVMNIYVDNYTSLCRQIYIRYKMQNDYVSK